MSIFQKPNKFYPSLYTWAWPIGENSIAHSTGAVSVCLTWDGFDPRMLTDKENGENRTTLKQLIKLVGDEYYLENHFWRSFDHSKAEEYLDRNKNIVRGHDFGRFVREEMAYHIGDLSMGNRVASVLVAKAKGWSRTRKLNNQVKLSKQLEEKALALSKMLPGGKVGSHNDYFSIIKKTSRPDLFEVNSNHTHKKRFQLNYQLISQKPEWVEEYNCLKVGSWYRKTFLVSMYPEHPGSMWMDNYSNLNGVDMHVSQFIAPINTRAAINSVENEEAKTNSDEHKGKYLRQAKLDDLQLFNLHVSSENLAVAKNSYVISLSSSNPRRLSERSNELRHELDRCEISYVEGKNIEPLYYRVSQPGQGYQTQYTRPDHSEQLADMWPCIVYDSGASNPSELRMDVDNTAIGFVENEDSNHELGAGKTGSGKGNNTVVKVAETFPLGRDWYICEVGGQKMGSYRWVVEAYEGNFITIDPDLAVINPFPKYKEAKLDRDKEELPLNSELVIPTLNSISQVLVGETRPLDVFEIEVAEAVMQSLYVNPLEKDAPNFQDFLEMGYVVLGQFFEKGTPQHKVAKNIFQRVESFLSGPHGRRFREDTNVHFSEGITGIDLKPLSLVQNDELMKLFITFTGIRFGQLAFSRNQLSTILFDEIHECTRVAPKETATMVDQIVKMGRKDSGSFMGVSQEIVDLAVSPGTLNNMSHHSFYYHQDGRDEIRDRFKAIPAQAFEAFDNFGSPSGKPYRPCLHLANNKAYNLKLMFPQPLLDLSDTTDRESLSTKALISEKTEDIYTRLALFREYMDLRSQVDQEKRKKILTENENFDERMNKLRRLAANA